MVSEISKSTKRKQMLRVLAKIVTEIKRRAIRSPKNFFEMSKTQIISEIEDLCREREVIA